MIDPLAGLQVDVKSFDVGRIASVYFDSEGNRFKGFLAHPFLAQTDECLSQGHRADATTVAGPIIYICMDLQNFIDAEYCIDKYFDKHLTKRLDFYIDSRNAAVVSGRSTGFGLTNALAPSEDYATSVTLNVPAKDIEKLGAEMARDKQLSHDIEVLAKAWRGTSS